MSDETKTLYWLQTRICGMWSRVQFHDTLEDARKALRVRAENYKGEKLRIVRCVNGDQEYRAILVDKVALPPEKAGMPVRKN